MRIAGAIFVAMHGIGHIIWFFSTWTPRVLGKAGRADLESHRSNFLVPPEGLGGKAVGVLSLGVIGGFVASAAGIWSETSWWPPLLIASAVASLLVIFAMWNPIRAPGPVSLSVRALLANVGLSAATLMPWGEKFLGAH